MQLFLLMALHGLGVTGLAGTVKSLCSAQTGIQRAPRRRIPWEEKVCDSTQGIQLAGRVPGFSSNSQDYFAWVSFCFGLFYAKVVCCKIHEHSWESSPQAAESSDHGMVVQRAGHSHLCLSAAGRKQATSTDPSEEALGMKGVEAPPQLL